MNPARDPAAWLKALQQAVRAGAGRALAPALRRWRNTLSDGQAPPPEPAVERFLVRFGSLDADDSESERRAAYAEHLARLARATGEAPGVIGAWLGAFARGEYGALDEGVCGDAPRCEKCPLAESCRFLGRGARELHSEADAENGRAVPPAAADVLALLAGEGRGGARAQARAAAALKALGGVRGVLAASAAKLREAGFGDPAVARVRAAAELFRLWTEEHAAHGKVFARGADFFEHYRLRLRDLKKERFYVTCLDQKNRLLGEEQVSEGSLTEALVHPREVFNPAIRLGAAAVAVVHNHPSGDPKPSRADKLLTKRLKDAAELLGIRLLDHVVVGDGAFTSFVEEGLL
ncbi:MAG: JAB domain-containing protein [Planctomycetota bacterium]|nr:JAB domain-containing protein [Planctomycetota bacterium]